MCRNCPTDGFVSLFPAHSLRDRQRTSLYVASSQNALRDILRVSLCLALSRAVLRASKRPVESAKPAAPIATGIYIHMVYVFLELSVCKCVRNIRLLVRSLKQRGGQRQSTPAGSRPSAKRAAKPWQWKINALGPPLPCSRLSDLRAGGS